MSSSVVNLVHYALEKLLGVSFFGSFEPNPVKQLV
jgi:hypothetical protein